MITRTLVWACAAALFVPACGAPDDAQDTYDPAAVERRFDEHYVPDYEADAEEDRLEEQELAALDQLDDLDDPDADLGQTAQGLVLRAQAKRPPHGPLSIMEDDPSFSGPESMRWLGEAKRLGVDVIRVMVMWRTALCGDGGYGDPRCGVERPAGLRATDPAQYDWSRYDTIVKNAHSLGLKVLITLAAPIPLWASEEPQHCAAHLKDEGFWSCSWKPRVSDVARFVTAAGLHFNDKRIFQQSVWAWTFWNEPNIGGASPSHSGNGFLSDESSYLRGMRYRELWFRAHKALRRTARVKRGLTLFGDIAHGCARKDPKDDKSAYVCDGTSARWRMLSYALCLRPADDPEESEVLKGEQLRKCPDAPRRVWPSGVALHPYAGSPSEASRSTAFLQELVREAAERKRLPDGRAVYVTEAGFLTRRGDDALGTASTVTIDQQGLYLQQVERLYYDRNVRTVAQYELKDEGRGSWDCGLLLPDGAPKPTIFGQPVHELYRFAVSGAASDKGDLDLFVLRRGQGGGTVELQLFDNGWQPLAPVTLDALGYGTTGVGKDLGQIYKRYRFFDAKSGEASRELSF